MTTHRSPPVGIVAVVSPAPMILALAQPVGGTQTLGPPAPMILALAEQFASASTGRLRLHSGLSTQTRKQYGEPSLCSTQAEPCGHVPASFPHPATPQYPPLKGRQV
jgi:hypothetical protein